MAPVYRVIYTSALQNHGILHCTEWVCPADYDETKARRSFRERYPTAAIIQLRQWEF